MSIIGEFALGNKEAWTQGAICSSTDSEIFFPEKGSSTRDAKKVCAACPVAAQCLAYAMRTDQRFGVWGGASERERRRLKQGLAPLVRTHCMRQHELAKVGVTSQGSCRECHNMWNRKYQQKQGA